MTLCTCQSIHPLVLNSLYLVMCILFIGMPCNNVVIMIDFIVQKRLQFCRQNIHKQIISHVSTQLVLPQSTFNFFFFFLLLEILFFCILFYVYCFFFSFFSLVAYNYVSLTSSVLSLSIYMTMLSP